MVSYVFLLCGLVVLVSGQSTEPPPPPPLAGPCPAFTPVATLDSAKAAGKYFIAYETRGGFGSHDAKHSEKCLTMELINKPDGSFNQKFQFITPDNKPVNGNSSMTLLNGKNTQQTVVTEGKEIKTVMTFLEVTPNYAVYVVCESDGKGHRYTVEVASRQKTVDAATLDKIKALLKTNKITAELHPIPQTC